MTDRSAKEMRELARRSRVRADRCTPISPLATEALRDLADDYDRLAARPLNTDCTTTTGDTP